MSIKIDLLPGYVGLRRLLKVAAAAGASLIGLVAAILVVLTIKGNNEVDKWQTDLDNITKVANLKTAADAATSTAQSEAAPLQGTVNFIVAASQTGSQRAALVDLCRQYISDNVVITNMDLSDGTNLKLDLTLKSPADFEKFLLNLRRGATDGTLFSNLPSAAEIPGFPAGPNLETTAGAPAALTPGAFQVIKLPLPISAQGALKYPVTVPSEPGTATAVAANPFAPVVSNN